MRIQGVVVCSSTNSQEVLHLRSMAETSHGDWKEEGREGREMERERDQQAAVYTAAKLDDGGCARLSGGEMEKMMKRESRQVYGKIWGDLFR